MLEWFGIKQILWLCALVMNFIYNHIASNVGLSIIIYALFVHFLFLPFSIKDGFDKINREKIRQKREELKREFDALPEEDRANEDIKKEFRKRESALRKKTTSLKTTCLILVLRLFALVAATPVVNDFGHYVKASDGSYRFFCFDLRAEAPGISFTPEVLLPLFVALVISVPGIIRVIKNLRADKLVQAQKSKEELEEEARLLKEMGIKEKKIPTALIVQCLLGVLYFYLFSRFTPAVSLFWGSYYVLDFVVKGAINSVFAKISVQLHKKQGEE